MMMMMMMTMENVVDDVDVMTTTAKQCSSKISKKKKRTTLLFLAIYQSVVVLRHDVFLRLSVSLSVCKSAFIIRASWSGERFFGGRNFFKTENVPFFFKEKHKCVTRHEERLTKCKKNGEKGIIPRAAEEEEEGERRARRGNGAVEAWTDQVVDGVGVASQGCICIACLVEIEYDRSVFL